MEQTIPPLKETQCSVKIEYGDSLRSIDLENILTGIRMIYQHELAKQFRMKPRDFTDLTRIKSIEAGCIDITYVFNWFLDNIEPGLSIASNAITLSTAIKTWFDKRKTRRKNRSKDSKSTEIHINNIEPSLRHGITITIIENAQEVKISSSNNGEIQITINPSN